MDPLYNVQDYGATGSGTVLDTPGVNAAIAAAAAAGGGTVYFPAGTYLCFSIHLLSNVLLYLAQGCTILAANSPTPSESAGQLGGAYDPAEPQDPAAAPSPSDPNGWQDYGHNHWHNSLIWAVGQSNIGIAGPGLINGQGLSNGNNSGPGSQFSAEQTGVGNKSIALKNCWNVTLRDFSILQGGWFGMLLTGVGNVTIDNLKIDTNRDGMDIDCCNNVRISNCTVNSPWDDGICLKSSYALGYLKVTENVTIANCMVSGCYQMGTVLNGTFQKIAGGPGTDNATFCGRIKCGTESNGGFQRISISNCVFEGCNGLAIESVDGAICEDIAITNITMRDLVSGPLFFVLGNRLRGPAGTEAGVLRRVLVSNVVASNSNPLYTCIITGTQDSQGNTYRIEDIKIANFYMQQQGGGTATDAVIDPGEFNSQTVSAYPDPRNFGIIPATGFFLRHIDGLEMSHLQIANVATDIRYPFVLQDVNTSWWNGITVPWGFQPTNFGFWPIENPQVKDFHIRSSQASGDLDIE